MAQAVKTEANPAPTQMDVWGDGSVTVATLAKIVGKTKQTNRNWMDEGCPIAHRGGPMRPA